MGVVVIIAGALTATLASTAAGSPVKKKKTINIAVFLASAANTYWEASLQGAKDVQKKNPNVKLTVFDGQFTTNKQLGHSRRARLEEV